MNRDGFTGGVDVGYQTGADKYGVIILQFRDVKAATDYYRVHLKDLCTLAVVSAPLRGLQGVAYMRDDDLAKAVFVVGNTEVALDICSCVEVQSRLTLAARWAAAVKQQLSPPSL
jgi:hypothetical protein